MRRDGRRCSDAPADGGLPPQDRPGQLPFYASRAVLSQDGEFKSQSVGQNLPKPAPSSAGDADGAPEAECRRLIGPFGRLRSELWRPSDRSGTPHLRENRIGTQSLRYNQLRLSERFCLPQRCLNTLFAFRRARNSPLPSRTMKIPNRQ